MANLPETSTFDTHVVELETTDLVLGGPGGPANGPTQNLTNRTRWLFDQNTANVAAISAIGTHLSTLDGEVSTIFGDISAINANLTSINGQLPNLAPLASPAFTGAPTAPTPPGGNNTTRIATTNFVANAVSALAPLASPALTGTPTAPTQASGDSSTKIATTAFVNPGSSLVTNGFRRNPDGSIEQWGTANPAGGTITVTLPTAFSSLANFFAIVGTSTGVPTQCNAHQLTASTFSLSNTGGTSSWRAIGK